MFLLRTGWKEIERTVEQTVLEIEESTNVVSGVFIPFLLENGNETQKSERSKTPKKLVFLKKLPCIKRNGS